ncbi:MAG: glycine cleavage system protein GcvH [Planctomycetota bacterium]|nr:MAG: glycine cleavage system protein GcvH [Planctomycetota bacterium]REJ96861.1 MAG: glycine cleavage system protein GcvH [Planctomycetota bacterium]REK24050.1 MAG: glycine cleavage system protein GcvH [Planctomycetota bacterium]REK39381.1 MAG: glycine cleavage system protein GcvH [Planctomycetota bacterium]
MSVEDLLFAKTHEWVRVSEADGGKLATLGISAFAVEALTDLVFLELPEVGRQVSAGDSFGEIESVKAVSDIYSPVSGEVVEVNDELPNKLELFNDDPYGAGWIAKIRMTDEADLAALLSPADYEKLCAEEAM